jgi:hypothetical protein
VDEDALETVFAGGAKKSVEVFLVRVDAAIGDKAEEMKLAVAVTSAALGVLHGCDDGGIPLELVFGDQLVDAGDIHVNDAASAEVEMADFAVPHLAVGQADEVLRRADKGVGILAEELVVGGLAGESDGVVGGFSTVAPSVKDGENEGKQRRVSGRRAEESGLGAIRSGDCERALSYVFVGWPKLDLYVVPKAVKTLHKFGFGEIGKIAAHQTGDLGLRNSHLPCGLLLSQSETPHCARNLNCQGGLDLQFVGIGKSKIAEDISGANFELDILNCAPGHFESPLRQFQPP